MLLHCWKPSADAAGTSPHAGGVQDPNSSLNPRLSILQIIEEGIARPSAYLTALQRENEVRRVMAEVGLDPVTRHRYPAEFSADSASVSPLPRADPQT